MKDREKQTVKEATRSDAGKDGDHEETPAAIERAVRLAEAGKHGEAIEVFTAYLDNHDPDVRALLGLGRSLLAMGRFEAAEKELRRALRVGPKIPEVLHTLGVVLFKRGVYEGAAAELRKVIDIDPEHSQAYQVLGESLNQLGQSQAAVQVLEHAVRLDPENAKAYYAMGIAYDRMALPGRAAEMYRQARSLSDR